MTTDHKNIIGSRADGMKRKRTVMACVGITTILWLCLVLATAYWTAKQQRHTDQLKGLGAKFEAKLEDPELAADSAKRLLLVNGFAAHTQRVNALFAEAQRSYEQLVWIICLGAIPFHLLALGMLWRERRT